jgi:hypothetical protein
MTKNEEATEAGGDCLVRRNSFLFVSLLDSSFIAATPPFHPLDEMGNPG